MKCPKCEFENPDDAQFCIECGNPIEFHCPKCGAITPASGKFCKSCGHNLTLPSEPSPKDLSFDEKIDKIQRYLPKGLTEKILAQRDKIEGEHKQVTVMFCDMEGFTRLSERLGPEEAYSIMDKVYEILIHKVHDYEGTVNEMTGDGIMALFGAPIALEDAPQRAIRSAYSIHREMSKFSDKIKQERESIPPVKMRIGIHSGPVVVGTLGNDLRVEFKAVGDTVNLASRMEKLAEPGATYVTGDTFRLTEGLFRFEALGEKEVKGKEEPVKIYRVIAPSTRKTRFDVSAERGLTPLVGRERELELLLNGFERAKGGRGQALSVMAEAGVGKSRLLYEFRKAIANEDVTFLEGKCLSYSSGVAYHPVIDVLKSNFDVREEDGDSEIREKFKRGLKILGADEDSTLPYLLELFSVKESGIDKIPMSPEEKKHRITEAVNEITIRGSEIRPLVIAFEDLHWVDKSSEDYLKNLLDSISGARVFLVFTYRPEFVHTWGGRSYHSQVNLNRLSNQESLLMVSQLLGTDNLDRELEELILEKTEGVPFFIEEFIKSLKDLNIIEREDAKYRLAKEVQAVSVPSTIHDMIMARVDSLPEGAKELLQTGSVIEREFVYELIKVVSGFPEKELLSHLSVLKDAELLYERGIYPQSTYIFKHALTQVVAYDSLLVRRRQELHRLIGQAIKELYADRLEDHYESLAHHYELSGNAEKAADYLILAGEKSNRIGAAQTAFEFLKKALKVSEEAHIKLSPETKVRLHFELALAQQALGAVGDVVKGLRKTIDLSRRHGMVAYEKESLRNLAWTIRVWPVRSEAERMLEEGMARAREMDDKGLEGYMLYSMAVWATGDYGQRSKAYQMLLDAEKLALSSAAPRSFATAGFLRFGYERWLGRPRKAVELTEGTVEKARSLLNVTELSVLTIFRGTALAEIGQIEDSIALIRSVIDICEKFRVTAWIGPLYNCLGYCYGEIYQLEQAWKFNLKSEEIARNLLEKYPMGRRQWAHAIGVAETSIVENLLDQGKIDEAWERIKATDQESKGEGFDYNRYQWESRMKYLAAQVLLLRNDLDQAETIIQENLKKVRKDLMKKREGSFLRVLGEVQMRRNEHENAITTLNESIHILEEVENPRQLWQAHASLGSVFVELNRISEAHEHWVAAAEVIQNTAKGLSDRNLREGFLKAEPVRQILSKVEG